MIRSPLKLLQPKQLQFFQCLPSKSCFLVSSIALLQFSAHIWATQYPSCSQRLKTEYSIWAAASPLQCTRGQSLPRSCWTQYLWCRQGQHWPSLPPHHCWLIFIQLMISIPQSSSDRQLSSNSFPNLYCCMGSLTLKCCIWHLTLLDVTWLGSAHQTRLPRSLCKALLPSSRLSVLFKSWLSSNLVRSHYIRSLRSLIEMLNKIGPILSPGECH